MRINLSTKHMLWVVAICFSLYSCSSDSNSSEVEEEPNPLTEINLSRAEQAIVDNSNAFALNLLKEIAADKNENLMVSPYSVANVLAVLANAATPEAQAQIAAALNGGDSDMSICNELYPRLTKELPEIDKKTNLKIANGFLSIYNAQALLNDTPILDVYDIEILDSSKDNVQELINAWVASKTDNVIKSMQMESLKSQNFYFASMNATYFKSSWARQFDPDATKKSIFNGVNHMGECYMMNESNMTYSQAIESDHFTFARIPYGNRAFSYIVAMPNANCSLEDGASYLDEGEWDEVAELIWIDTQISIEMPKFTITNTVDLCPMLENMGITDIFDKEKSPLFTSHQLFLGEVKQSGVMELDEEGAKLATVTVASGLASSSSPLKSVKIDRPFFFFVQEQSTRAILFMGKVSQL